MTEHELKITALNFARDIQISDDNNPKTAEFILSEAKKIFDWLDGKPATQEPGEDPQS